MIRVIFPQWFCFGPRSLEFVSVFHFRWCLISFLFLSRSVSLSFRGHMTCEHLSSPRNRVLLDLQHSPVSSFTSTLNRFSCQASNHPVLSLTAQLFTFRFLCNYVLYRISLFLFSVSLSLSLSLQAVICAYQTTSSLVGFDTRHVVGMKHAASLRSLIFPYVRLHQTQTIRVWSSQVSVYKL